MSLSIRFKLQESPGGKKVSVVGSLKAIGSWVPQNALHLWTSENGAPVTEEVQISSEVQR